MNIIRIRAIAVLLIVAAFLISSVIFYFALRIGLLPSLVSLLIFIAAVWLWISFKMKRYERFRKAEYRAKVSILVPAKDEEKVLRETLELLAKLDYPDYEVIVINDGSKDATSKIAHAYARNYKNFHVIDIPEESPIHGKAHALNRGFEIVKGEIILVLDADARVPRTYLNEAVRPFGFESIDGVQTGIEAYNGSRSFPAFVSAQDLLFTNIFMSFFLPGRSFGQGFLMRKRSFEKVFPLKAKSLSDDEQVNMYIYKKRLRVAYMPFVRVKQHVPENWRTLLKQRRRWFTGLLYENLRNGVGIALVNITVVLLLDMSIVTFFVKPLSFPALVLDSFLILGISALVFMRDDFGIENPLNTGFGTVLSYLIDLLMLNYAIIKLPFVKESDLKWERTPKSS